MSELSIFCDESGDFGEFKKHSPYYVVTIVIHDQSADISNELVKLDDYLHNTGFDNSAIHTAPLIRREPPYENMEPNDRRAIFMHLYYFALKCDIRYKTFFYEKRHYEDEFKLEARMSKDISFFLRQNLNYFESFDNVIIYYDKGQKQITRLLNTVFAAELTSHELRNVSPKDYRLFQAADLLCTIATLEKHYELNTLTKSEMLLFHSRKQLRKDILKQIKKKDFEYIG